MRDVIGCSTIQTALRVSISIKIATIRATWAFASAQRSEDKRPQIFCDDRPVLLLLMKIHVEHTVAQWLNPPRQMREANHSAVNKPAGVFKFWCVASSMMS